MPAFWEVASRDDGVRRAAPEFPLLLPRAASQWERKIPRRDDRQYERKERVGHSKKRRAHGARVAVRGAGEIYFEECRVKARKQPFYPDLDLLPLLRVKY